MKILVAEDDPIARQLLEGLLNRWDYEVISTCDGRAAWEVMRADDSPEIAIIDWIMPKMDGPQLCSAVRRLNRDRYPYLVLLTIKGRTENIVEGLDAGADDYLVKPVNENELLARLRAGLRLHNWQDKLFEAQRCLRDQATRDALTGLWNRGVILEFLERELGRLRRQGGNLGIIMADLDHFKQINDTYGHLAGDGVLQEIARRLQSVFRDYDGVGRYGGEEFLIIAPNCDLNESMILGNRLNNIVGAEPIALAEAVLNVTTSVGVTAISGNVKRSVRELLRTADLALYDAKRAGGNCVMQRALAADAPAQVFVSAGIETSS